MANPLILYSCGTWLAFTISETYYRGVHYVWCAPVFDPNSRFASPVAVPPTSSPREIYHNLFEEITRGDKHSAKVAQNRLGILRGADKKLSQGIITAAQRDEIIAIASCAELRDFRPLLIVIPFKIVSKRVKQVPIKDRAHPLSEEFIIENLQRSEFDILELR
jgi:hypothetical protein